MFKYHRIVAIVPDQEGYGINDLKSTLERGHGWDGGMKILEFQSIDVPSDEIDYHPLNLRLSSIEEKLACFKVPKDGNQYISRTVKPDSELEARVKVLEKENQELWQKIGRAKQSLC